MEHHDINAEDISSSARPADVCSRSTDGQLYTGPSSHSNIDSVSESGSIALKPACQLSCNSSLTMNSRNIIVDNNNVKVEVKPDVSTNNSVVDVNNKRDGNDSGITIGSAVSSVDVANIASLCTSDQDEIGCLSVGNVGVGGNSVSHSDGSTVRANIRYPRCNEESSRFHGHAVVLNMQHDESSTELSTCLTPPSLTCSTSFGMSTTNSDKIDEAKSITSKESNVDRVELAIVHESTGCHEKCTTACTDAATNDNSIDDTPASNSDRWKLKDTHRRRNDRTLHSHTATQAKKHKKRHDATIIKKRKLRSLSDAMTSNGNSSHQNLSSDSDSKETESVSNPSIVTSRSTSSNEPSSVLTSSNPAANVKLIEDAQGCVTVTVPTPVDCQSSEDEEASDGNSQSTVLHVNDAIDEHISCVSEMKHEEQQVSLSVLNCDTNAVLSCREMSYTTMEEFHSTDASVARNDAICLTERNHVDDDNNLDVTDVTNELSTMTNANQTSSVSGDGELNLVPILCYLESSGDEEISELEIPPLHIIYRSRTSVDNNEWWIDDLPHDME
ncbi:unnamed protein product [Schistosoma turkestanicum]|nr:unnamed protein product [Schistosoma turkestanicum]